MTPIRLGFMPLIDAAVPIVAAKRGFAAGQGLAISLLRETSWANIRDRLAIGDLDAAHLLAPLPLATALRLTPMPVPLVVPMALGLGGNGITVSRSLWGQMKATKPDLQPGLAASVGEALHKAIAQRREAGLPRLSLAVVHSFSAHNYELRYWLSACGIVPDQDIEICIISPPLMPGALSAGRIDGFCVGEPWNSVAQQSADGAIILTKSQIWRASPEKVLSVRQEWADAHPDILTRLVAACIQAAAWAGDPANADDLVALLAEPDALNMPAAHILPALRDGLILADGSRSARADGVIFHDGAATYPWHDHAAWFLRAMAHWEGLGLPEQAIGTAAQAYRPDLYRAAAASLGLNAPAVDEKPDGLGAELTVPGTLQPLQVMASTFFDR